MILDALTKEELVCAGACWHCGNDVLVHKSRREWAASFFMLFCGERCYQAAEEKDQLDDNSRALIIHNRKVSPNPYS